MKTAFLFLVTLTFFLVGCSSSENTASKENMKVVNASFSSWSEPPPSNSDIPERGIDLTLTIHNWPQGYKPKYIVYDKRKSLAASVADSNEKNVVITGRIIRTSSVLVETSESMEVSDRLVFTDSEGETGFIEIDNWQREQE